MALGDAALHELLLLRVHHRFDLLAHGFAQIVGFLHGVAGHRPGDLHHLLLVDQYLVGGIQDLLQGGVERHHPRPPGLAVGVQVVHVGPHRPGPVQGHQRHHVVEAIRA